MTETAIVKPLEWDGNKAEAPYGTYRYEWQTGAGAQDGYYKAELNFDIIIIEKRCDWPEIQEACEAYHQKVIADTLDLTAYRKAVLEEARESPSDARFLKAPEPVARPDEEWCNRYAEWHEARYGEGSIASIRDLAEKEGA